jgi:hypothetical protein
MKTTHTWPYLLRISYNPHRVKYRTNNAIRKCDIPKGYKNNPSKYYIVASHRNIINPCPTQTPN